jgi:hypothetical protein
MRSEVREAVPSRTYVGYCALGASGAGAGAAPAFFFFFFFFFGGSLTGCCASGCCASTHEAASSLAGLTAPQMAARVRRPSIVVDDRDFEPPRTRAFLGHALLQKGRSVTGIWRYILSPACVFIKRMFEFHRSWGWSLVMSQNMRSLSRVLATAALASAMVVLLMSYKLGHAEGPQIAKVIRLHPK